MGFPALDKARSIDKMEFDQIVMIECSNFVPPVEVVNTNNPE